ncbi:TraV family lipoprotein (plasmid) [Alteromonas macleodii]
MKRKLPMIKKHLQNALLLGGVVALSGCAVGGYDEFSCPDPQEGVCTDAYNAAQLAESGKDTNDFPSNTHLKHSSGKQVTSQDNGHSHSEEPSSGHSDDVENTSPYRDVAPVAGLMSRPVDQPKPVLMPATVLEMWFDSYEDSNGILRMPQTAFAEVTPRRWALNNTKIERYKSAGPFSSNTVE